MSEQPQPYPDCCDFHRETKDMFILMKCADRASDDAVELQKQLAAEREKVKTLVERLQESNGVLKVLLNFSDDVKRVHAKTLCEVIDKNTDALRDFGVSVQQISRIANGQQWKSVAKVKGGK